MDRRENYTVITLQVVTTWRKKVGQEEALKLDRQPGAWLGICENVHPASYPHSQIQTLPGYGLQLQVMTPRSEYSPLSISETTVGGLGVGIFSP